MPFFRRPIASKPKETRSGSELSEDELNWLRVHRQIAERSGERTVLRVIKDELVLMGLQANSSHMGPEELDAWIQYTSQKLTLLLLIYYFQGQGLEPRDAILQANALVTELAAELGEAMKGARAFPEMAEFAQQAIETDLKLLLSCALGESGRSTAVTTRWFNARVMATTSIDSLAVRNKADWLWLAIQEQRQRIFDRLPAGNRPSHLEVARLSSEFDFFIDVVSRLLRLADLTQAEVHGANLVKAIGAFNTVSPDVRKVRDTIQHFDAYSLGKGRRQDKGEASSEFLFTKEASSGELVVTYAKLEVAVNATSMAAGSLHDAIRSAVDVEARKDPAWDEPIA